MNRTLPIQLLMSIAAVVAAVALPATADAASDTSPPTLQGVSLPATVSDPSVAVASTAADDVAVSQVRLANEDGTWSTWRPYASPITWELSPGTGYKAVFVQVRDAAGEDRHRGQHPGADADREVMGGDGAGNRDGHDERLATRHPPQRRRGDRVPVERRDRHEDHHRDQRRHRDHGDQAPEPHNQYEQQRSGR